MDPDVVGSIPITHPCYFVSIPSSCYQLDEPKTTKNNFWGKCYSNLRSGKRRETRRLALELLGRHALGEEPKLLLEEASFLGDELDFAYLSELFGDILNRHQELDAHIRKFLKGWRLERLNRVDHSILLIATYELMFMQKQIPPKSAINEAVELAKEFGSTEKTPGFVNAILDNIWHSIEGEKVKKA